MRRRNDNFLTLLVLSILIVVIGAVTMMSNADIGIILVILGLFTASITAVRRLSRGIR